MRSISSETRQTSRAAAGGAFQHRFEIAARWDRCLGTRWRLPDCNQLQVGLHGATAPSQVLSSTNTPRLEAKMVSSRVISYPERTSPTKIPIAEQEGHTHVLVIHFKISLQSVFCFLVFFFNHVPQISAPFPLCSEVPSLCLCAGCMRIYLIYLQKNQIMPHADDTVKRDVSWPLDYSLHALSAIP